MLIVRAPLRISLGGGGSDLAAYYNEYGGLVISTTINRYFYTVISKEDTESLQIISADYGVLFRQSSYKDLYWDGDLALPKAILHHFRIKAGLNLFMASEVPPGTGLGSSSAAAVALVHACATLQAQMLTRKQLAELSSFIEIEKMGMPIGKQDQYAAAFGGLNKIMFTRQGVEVEPLHLAADVLQRLERRLMLFFTGSSRVSTTILQQQQRATAQHDPTVLHSLHGIKQAAIQMQACLEQGNLERFAELLDFSWREKRRLAPGLTTHFIDDCYTVALANGATSGKITGAGGGGFLLLYCEEAAQERVTAALEELGVKRMNFRFSQEGAQVIVNTLAEDDQAYDPVAAYGTLKGESAHGRDKYLL